MALTPIGKNIIVQLDEVKKETASGIILPSSTEKERDGTIVAIGSEVKEVKVGDKILFTDWAGTNFEKDGAKYVVMEEKEALVVIT